MKKVWKRTLFFVLAAVSALCFAAGCAKTEPGKVESVTITYNGSALGDSLTVNLARGAVGLGVNVEISGEGVSQEATLESSNETVATISESGYNVILVTAGETVITATSVADSSKSDSFTLTVEPVEPEVVSISIADENGAAFENGAAAVGLAEGTLQLTVTVETRGEMTDEYTLESSDTDVATVDNEGLVTLAGVGNTVITAKAAGDEEVTTQLDLTVYDSNPHNISVTGGSAQNADGETITQAVYGDVITLVPDAAEEGMVFAGWNAEGTKVEITDNTFVFPGADVSLTAVYGREPSDFELNFNSGDYNPVLSEDGSKVTFTYTGIDSHSYNNVSTPIDYPASAECNRFSFTVWNLGTRDVDFMLVLSRDGEEISKEFRLNGENGFQATVPAGSVQTYISEYTSEEVKRIGLFIDSTEWEPTVPQEYRSGCMAFGNFAFFTESEVVSVSVADESGIPFAENKTSVGLTESSLQLTVNVETVGGMTNAYTLESSDPDVATVDNEGLVTLVGVGTAVITATAAGDPEKTAQLTLTVYDDETHTITVNGGSAQNEADETIAEAAYGEKITLVPDAAEEGMEFVGWNVSGADVEIADDNTFTFPGMDITLTAVYGYVSSDFELNFTVASDYYPEHSEDKKEVTFTYTNVGSGSWNNTTTSVTYPESANNNRFAFTVQNHDTTREVTARVVLSSESGSISSEYRLNGSNGVDAKVPAGGFVTVVCSYTPGEVKSIGIFIDSIDGGEPTTRSGKLTFSNFAFFSEEPAPVWAAESGDAKRYTVTDDAATGGWHVTYTGTNWNMYAGVKINLTNRGEIEEANKLVFKIKNNSSTHVPEYAVTVKGESGTLKENVKGTVPVNGETTVTVEWDGSVPVFVQIFLDDAWKENPTSDPSAEGDIVIYDFQMTAE